jgi:hypothetical protein
MSYWSPVVNVGRRGPEAEKEAEKLLATRRQTCINSAQSIQREESLSLKRTASIKQSLEDTMPKKALTPAQISRLLKFKIDWIKDPVPPFRKYLDVATLKRLAEAKVAFGKEINQIVMNGLRKP